MRLVVLAILCIQGVILYAEKPTHLKALVVFDSSGSKLQKYYRLDGKQMEKTLHSVASQTCLIPEIQAVPSNRLTHQKINAWIQTLSARDVAVFYYAGHETCARKDPWSSMIFSQTKKDSFPVTQLLTPAIRKQQPHLTLVLIDSYNKILRFSKKRQRLHIPPLGTAHNPRLAALFVESSGLVNASSKLNRRPGFALYLNRPIGGLLTNSIQKFLGVKEERKKASWDDFLDSINSRCLELSHKRQYPVLRQNIHTPTSGPVVQKMHSINK